MGKTSRNSAARTAVRDDRVITRERHQHGHITRSDKQILDDAGLISRPFLVRDILGVMESRGTITREMRAAGIHFRESFARGNLESLRCPDPERIPGCGRSTDDPMSVIAARDDVWHMVSRVGGITSPAGSCLWHVLGLEMSLQDWSLAKAWNGKPCNRLTASGILVAALGTLAA